MTSRHRRVSALDRVFPHLLILLYSLGAAVIYDHHWPYRGHGDSPILDLVEHHYPTFYKALTLWHYLPPVVVTYLAALLLPEHSHSSAAGGLHGRHSCAFHGIYSCAF